MCTRSRNSAAFIACIATLAMAPAATAQQGEPTDALVTYRALTVELALKAAQAGLASCRRSGYQVAIAVVDRGGNVQVLLRDRFAGPHTPDTAVSKAWTAVSFRADTSELVEPTQARKAQSGARHISGALMLGGGMKIEAQGSMVGGIGVSGAPTGKADEACARAGIDAIVEALEF